MQGGSDGIGAGDHQDVGGSRIDDCLHLQPHRAHGLIVDDEAIGVALAVSHHLDESAVRGAGWCAGCRLDPGWILALSQDAGVTVHRIDLEDDLGALIAREHCRQGVSLRGHAHVHEVGERIVVPHHLNRARCRIGRRILKKYQPQGEIRVG